MPRPFTPDSHARISIADVASLPLNGWRASTGSVAAATTTFTVLHDQVRSDLGRNAAHGISLALTDLVVYAQTAGAVVVVQSGTTTIWTAVVGAGSTVLPLTTWLVADKGFDLTVTVSAAGTSCALAATGVAV
jgi:hypothetical protein